MEGFTQVKNPSAAPSVTTQAQQQVVWRDMAVFPLEARSFEKKQIFQEEQKTIFAIFKLVAWIFLQFSPSIWVVLTKYEIEY